MERLTRYALPYVTGILIAAVAMAVGSCGESFAGALDRLCTVLDGIPQWEARSKAVAKALLLGERSGLGRELTDAFRAAGASHLLALSGMHMGIIYLIVRYMLAVLGNGFTARKLRSAAIIVLTGMYAMLCNTGPSLWRAWIFILLHEAGVIFERPQPASHIFLAALTLHLAVSPADITKIGFQLSYLAVAGIVFLWPRVRDWMDSAIWRMASLSICCQVTTGPVAWLYFGTFPRYFLMTNMTAAPLMSVTMACCIAAAALSLTPIPAITEIPASWLFRTLEFPVKWLCTLIGIISQM